LECGTRRSDISHYSGVGSLFDFLAAAYPRHHRRGNQMTASGNIQSAVLELKNIHKSFDKTEVLQGIDLEIEEGEFIVFVGPSGCGKSTLLRIIAGLEGADEGEVIIKGQRVNSQPPSKRGIAMVFQSYALYPHRDVRGNMSLGLKQDGISKTEIAQRIDWACEMLSLRELIDRRPAQLSGGQRQRVAIGRAIVRKPNLFLFDEPLSNLDAALRVNTRLEIARLHRQLTTTMIYVTHDQVEAMTLADRIVILNEKKIEQIGSPMELYNNPVNKFVAGFIGSPQMNFIDAKLLGRSDATTIGIRPEHISLEFKDGKIAGKITHIEQLGAETNLYLDCDDLGTISVRLVGQHLTKVGDKRFVTFESRHEFKFDDAGRTIT
jgi:multiple sugar transport system ATP-binding protein